MGPPHHEREAGRDYTAEEGGVRMAVERFKAATLLSGFEDGRRGHELRAPALETGKDKEMDSSLEPPEGARFWPRGAISGF